MNKSKYSYSSLDDDYECLPSDVGIEWCNEIKTEFPNSCYEKSFHDCTKDCKPACSQFKDENSCTVTKKDEERYYCNWDIKPKQLPYKPKNNIGITILIITIVLIPVVTLILIFLQLKYF